MLIFGLGFFITLRSASQLRKELDKAKTSLHHTEVGGPVQLLLPVSNDMFES